MSDATQQTLQRIEAAVARVEGKLDELLEALAEAGQDSGSGDTPLEPSDPK